MDFLCICIVLNEQVRVSLRTLVAPKCGVPGPPRGRETFVWSAFN